jgi:hypothetical protein
VKEEVEQQQAHDADDGQQPDHAGHGVHDPEC